jgi:hypothetical protein
MPIGPGKYDDVCTDVRNRVKAKAAIVVILDGNKGNGFSCQGYVDDILRLPQILRTMATEIETSGV